MSVADREIIDMRLSRSGKSDDDWQDDRLQPLECDVAKEKADLEWAATTES